MTKSKAECIRLIDSVFWAIDHACNRNQHRDDHTDAQRRMTYGLQRSWNELLEECQRQERQHRRGR